MMPNRNDSITKDDVKDLLKRFNLASAKVLAHPKFDDDSRDLAIKHTAAYIIALKELVDVSGDVMDTDSIPVIMTAAEYLKLVDEFCAD